MVSCNEWMKERICDGMEVEGLRVAGVGVGMEVEGDRVEGIRVGMEAEGEVGVFART